MLSALYYAVTFGAGLFFIILLYSIFSPIIPYSLFELFIIIGGWVAVILYCYLTAKKISLVDIIIVFVVIFVIKFIYDFVFVPLWLATHQFDQNTVSLLRSAILTLLMVLMIAVMAKPEMESQTLYYQEVTKIK